MKSFISKFDSHSRGKGSETLKRFPIIVSYTFWYIFPFRLFERSKLAKEPKILVPRGEKFRRVVVARYLKGFAGKTAPNLKNEKESKRKQEDKVWRSRRREAKAQKRVGQDRSRRWRSRLGSCARETVRTSNSACWKNSIDNKDV